MMRVLMIMFLVVALVVGVRVWKIQARSERVDQEKTKELSELAECLATAGLANPVVEADRYAEFESPKARAAFRRARGGISFGDHGGTFGGNYDGPRADGTVIIPRNDRDARILDRDSSTEIAGRLVVHWLDDRGDEGDLESVRSCDS